MKAALITFFLTTLGLLAQDRYVTVMLPDTYYPSQQLTTNTLEIASGETAHLVSLNRSANHSGYQPGIYVKKGDGAAIAYFTATTQQTQLEPLVVNGPAKILTFGLGGMATFKITPDQYPPDRTVVVPGGPGGAHVTMECSTNLVHWVPAENGSYTNLPGVKFFRIKLDRIQP